MSLTTLWYWIARTRPVDSDRFRICANLSSNDKILGNRPFSCNDVTRRALKLHDPAHAPACRYPRSLVRTTGIASCRSGAETMVAPSCEAAPSHRRWHRMDRLRNPGNRTIGRHADRQRLRPQPPVPLLLEHCPAGLAEVRSLPPQAGGDGADVGDFAGAEPIDIGGAGAPLFRGREISGCGPCHQRHQQQAERQRRTNASCQPARPAKTS
jgi:hypothetical protein